MSVMPPPMSSAAEGDEGADDDVAIESVREVVAKQNSKVRKGERWAAVLNDPELVRIFTIQLPGGILEFLDYICLMMFMSSQQSTGR